MPRQIFVEEQQEEQVQQGQQNGATQAAKVIKKTSTSIEGDGEQVTVTSDELQKLFHEWDAQGHTDLSVNSTLATRIVEYLAYQEQMDPLRRKIAERIYKPYICDGNAKVFAELTVNDKRLGKIEIYAVGSHYKVIGLSDFRSILIALGNPYAKWIEIREEDETGIDIEAYILDNGGKCEVDIVDREWSNEYSIRITL